MKKPADKKAPDTGAEHPARRHAPKPAGMGFRLFAEALTTATPETPDDDRGTGTSAAYLTPPASGLTPRPPESKTTAATVSGDPRVSEARETVKTLAAEPAGVRCPCCDRLAKVYPRRISPAMVDFMRALAESAVGTGDRTNIETGTRDDRGRATVALTLDGIGFLAGTLSVPRWARVYDGDFIGFDGELVTVADCQAAPLGGSGAEDASGRADAGAPSATPASKRAARKPKSK